MTMGDVSLPTQNHEGSIQRQGQGSSLAAEWTCFGNSETEAYFAATDVWSGTAQLWKGQEKSQLC